MREAAFTDVSECVFVSMTVDVPECTGAWEGVCFQSAFV